MDAQPTTLQQYNAAVDLIERNLAARVNRAANSLTDLGLLLESRLMPIAVNTLLTNNDFDFMLRDSRTQALIVPIRCSPMAGSHFPAANSRCSPSVAR